MSETMISESLLCLSAIVCTVVTAGYFYYRCKFSFWSKQELHGPSPSPVFGNTLDTLLHAPVMDVYEKDNRLYGDVYGVYDGSRPGLIVSDPEILKKILVSDFTHFTNRNLTGFDHPMEKKMFFLLEGDDWRSARATCSQAFSSLKIKSMSRHIHHSAEYLVQVIGKRQQQTSATELEVKELYKAYALNAMGKSLFGIEVDAYDWNAVDPMWAKALNYFKVSNLSMVLSMILPSWFKTMINFTVFNKEGLVCFELVTKGIIDKRRNCDVSREYDDFVSIMIKSNMDQNRNERMRVFSDQEITANCATFLIAGTETSTLALTIISYLLATHPKEQQKLYEEIKGASEGDLSMASKKLPSSETLASLEYLDAIIKESLRLFPPAVVAERRVSQEYTLELKDGKKVTLPLGSFVWIPIFNIHRSEKNFFRPNDFIPDRFIIKEEKNSINPMTYMPFGAGPRNCIGMRLALVNVKHAIASILLNFKLEKGDKTIDTLDVSATNDDLLIIPDVFIKFTPRE